MLNLLYEYECFPSQGKMAMLTGFSLNQIKPNQLIYFTCYRLSYIKKKTM